MKAEYLRNYIRGNPFFLAPMAGVTDKPFRSFMREMGCGVITSELISVNALQTDNKKTFQLLDFSEDQRPYGIQIFGEDPYSLGEGAKRVEDFGPDFIDLNLGCPVYKIVKKGAGSALLKDLKSLSKVLQSLKKSVKAPLSLKIRTGWDSQTRNADKVSYMAFQEGFSWVSIHGRTRAQAYSGHADWDYIRKIKSKASLPIVGNGDIISGIKAFEALKFSGCDAVMIGRGCLNNPWVFLSAMDFYKKHLLSEDFYSKGASQKESLFDGKKAEKNDRTHLGSFSGGSVVLKQNFKMAIDKLKIHLENFYDERLFILQLKKFAVWFSSGFPNSSAFRKNLFQEKDKKTVLYKIDDFFAYMEDYEKPDPVYEPFLMRGHG